MKEKEEKLPDNEEEVDTDRGDDVVFEENEEVTSKDHKEKFDKLKAKIKQLEKEKGELLDKWQRDKAEFVNVRRRDEEDKKEFLKFAKSDIISELLSVLDSFESAFKNKTAWEKADRDWRVGVEYIHTQLKNVLKEHGLKIINPLGEMYDAKRDDAVGNMTIYDKKDDGRVLDVLSPGYELNGKEIRAPKVKVGHFEQE